VAPEGQVAGGAPPHAVERTVAAGGAQIPVAPTPLSTPASETPPPLHPRADAAEVLQRMDAVSSIASAAAGQPARHLEVGVLAGTLGWVEVRATANPSGGIEASLRTHGDLPAQTLSAQAGAIVEFARQHQVPLAQLSVGIGSGGSAGGGSAGGDSDGSRGSEREPSPRPAGTAEDPAPLRAELTVSQGDSATGISFINLRA
jgi:hypothetical protein